MFHTHLHLFNWTTHRNQFELLAVLVINHLHIFVLTSSRSSSGSSGSNWETYRTLHLHCWYHFRVAVNHHIVRNIVKLNGVHIMDEDRRVQTSLLHLHLKRLHILSSFLPPEVLNVLLVIHTNCVNVLHIIHIENVLIQVLRNHPLLQNVRRHSTSALVKEVLIPRERAVVRELLIEIRRIQTRLRHLLLQILNRLSKDL